MYCIVSFKRGLFIMEYSVPCISKMSVCFRAIQSSFL